MKKYPECGASSTVSPSFRECSAAWQVEYARALVARNMRKIAGLLSEDPRFQPDVYAGEDGSQVFVTRLVPLTPEEYNDLERRLQDAEARANRKCRCAHGARRGQIE